MFSCFSFCSDELLQEDAPEHGARNTVGFGLDGGVISLGGTRLGSGPGSCSGPGSQWGTSDGTTSMRYPASSFETPLENASFCSIGATDYGGTDLPVRVRLRCSLCALFVVLPSCMSTS